MTLKQLRETYTNIPWKTYLDGVLLQDFQLDDDFQVVVIAGWFLQKFSELIQVTPRNVVANYVFWRVVLQSAPYLSEEIRNIAFNLRGRNSVAQSQLRRERHCYNLVDDMFPIGIGAMYARRHFGREEKERVVPLVDDISNAFRSILEKVFFG